MGATLFATGAVALGASGDGVLDTTLVSRATGPAGTVGDRNSFQPSTSADARYVAFASDADNLDPDSNDAVTDVFVRDTQASTTTLLSRATGAAGAVGDGTSEAASISADGRYVAFYSTADTLDAEAAIGNSAIYVRDLHANTTILVSRASGADGEVSNAGGHNPSISADGRYVAFQSSADNLAPGTTFGELDVYVRDLQANTTTLVSRASGADGATGEPIGNAASRNPSISAGGRYVAFESLADNFDPDSNDDVGDIFVRDLQANTTTLVSRATGAAGAVGDDDSSDPSISADGLSVAFRSSANNFDGNSNGGVFARDLEANTTTRASRASGTGPVAIGITNNPSISADGVQVAFQSDADNLDTESDDDVFDIFVRDLEANTTTLASRATGADGAVGDGASVGPSISPDGRRVAFSSSADNFESEGLVFDVADVFVRELLDPVESTEDPEDPGSDPDDPGAGDAAGEVAASGRGIEVHRFRVPRSKRKLLAQGVRVLASCELDCLIVLKVRVSPGVARRLGLRTTLLGRGTGPAGAGEQRWVSAKLTRAAKRALRSHSGGGRLKIRVTGEAP